MGSYVFVLGLLCYYVTSFVWLYFVVSIPVQSVAWKDLSQK